MKINLQKEIAELSSMELRGAMESTKEERSQAAKFLGKLGGQASVIKRLAGKSKSEISEIMRTVRKAALTKNESKEFSKSVGGMVKNLNKNVKLEK